MFIKFRVHHISFRDLAYDYAITVYQLVDNRLVYFVTVDLGIV